MSQSQRRKKPFTKGRARKAVRLMPNVARVKRGKMRASQVSILVVLILQLIGRKKYFHCDWLKRVARVFKNFLNIWATLRGWLLVFWSGVGGGGTRNMFLGACIRVLVFLRVTGFFWADWACTFFFGGGGSSGRVHEYFVASKLARSLKITHTLPQKPKGPPLNKSENLYKNGALQVEKACSCGHSSYEFVKLLHKIRKFITTQYVTTVER